MRLLPPLLTALALASPALAIEPYAPLPLQPAKVLIPPDDLLADAAALLAAVQAEDHEAIGRYLAPQIRVVDGALELHVKRFTEILGPHETAEAMLSDLANYIGGDVEPPPPGGDPLPNRLRSERLYIEQSLIYAGPWSADPMIEGAICTYPYFGYDIAGITALAEATGVASSSFVYVDEPYDLHAEPNDASGIKGTLQTGLLYGLDYDAPAPGSWIGVYLPDGSTGFADFDTVELKKPYASGICFAKGEAGHWQIVAQVSTSL